MAKWLDIKGPVVADTVYADSTLVAKDVAFTLPGIEFLTADVQAMGNMTVPLIGLLENMELSITKIGVDNGLRRMNRLEHIRRRYHAYAFHALWHRQRHRPAYKRNTCAARRCSLRNGISHLPA